MIRIASVLALIASPLAAQESVAIKTSAVALSRDHGNIVVTFANRISNTSADDGEYMLAIDGLPVRIAFGWNITGGADAIHITPPAGWVCSPSCSIILPERATGRVMLFPVDQVGA